MTELQHAIALLIALAMVVGAGGLALWFWRGRARPPFGAFAFFFAVVTLLYVWLGAQDLLALVGAPEFARATWRPLVLRGGLCAAVWVLAVSIWRLRAPR